jgi:GNAT superfamily N-acetyltransferase
MAHPHETTKPEPFRLRDGRAVIVRRIRPDDAPRLGELAARLSPRALRLRFFTPVKTFSTQRLKSFAEVDFVRRAAFVVTFPESNDVLAVGRYEAESDTLAEVAFIVLDELQGYGLASELLQHLAVLARANGFERFTALTLAENREMLDVFRASGYPMTVHFEGGVERVLMDISTVLSPESSNSPLPRKGERRG